MWRKIVPYVFIFSVALNLAFLGIWGVNVLHGEAGSDLEPCNGCSQETQLHRLIETTDEQWRILKPLLREYSARRYALCKETDQARAELIDAIASPEPNFGGIRQRQDRILDVQRRMQDLTVEQLLREKEVLTPEQQEKVFAFFRDCCRCTAPEGEETGAGASCGGMCN